MPEKPNIVEENYKDVVASWLGPDYLVNNEEADNFEDLRKRNYSAAKIFNHGSSDSLDVENEMIMKLKP